MVKKKVSKRGLRNPWFRKRIGDLKEGWGFIPVNWKGVVALVVLIAINVFGALYFDLYVLEGRRWAKFGVVFLLSMLTFILIAKNKTRGVKDDL
jgi:hypothetical protein